MKSPTLVFAPKRRRLPLAWALIGLVLSAGCLPASPAPANPTAAALRSTAANPRSTATADVATFVIYPESAQTPAAAPTPPVSSALLATLTDYSAEPGDDPTGAKAAALVTLRNFIDANGPYRGAWWFEVDGRGEMDEILAVILYTEGTTSLAVRQAIAARFLWYCGGQSKNCQGHALVNFLAYFQGWREPWMVSSGFMNVAAKSQLALADDVLHQRGIVCEWIPGAEWFVQNPNGLAEAGPIDWEATPFHFANVHPTWDAYLRRTLRRPPNGANRLWVLTVAEADKVCQAGFVCPDMTQAKP
jgi:hypothetical protein